MSDLQSFLKENLHKKSPATVPVSHPDRGLDIINKKQLPLWKGWGWTEESWDVVDEPTGAKKTTRKSAKKSADKES